MGQRRTTVGQVPKFTVARPNKYYARSFVVATGKSQKSATIITEPAGKRPPVPSQQDISTDVVQISIICDPHPPRSKRASLSYLNEPKVAGRRVQLVPSARSKFRFVPCYFQPEAVERCRLDAALATAIARTRPKPPTCPKGSRRPSEGESTEATEFIGSFRQSLK